MFDTKIISLNPQIDENGLIRSGGRLENADYLPFDVKYPIILPRGNWITKLIVNYYHEKIIMWQVKIRPWQRYHGDFGS